MNLEIFLSGRRNDFLKEKIYKDSPALKSKELTGMTSWNNRREALDEFVSFTLRLDDFLRSSEYFFCNVDDAFSLFDDLFSNNNW